MDPHQIIQLLAALLVREGERFVHASDLEAFDPDAKLHITPCENPKGWYVRIAPAGEAPDPGERVILQSVAPEEAEP